MYYGASIRDGYDGSSRSGTDNGAYWIGALGFVAASAALFLFNTWHGIGIFPDTTRYMSVNEAPYDAPFYPWLLTGVSAFGLDLDAAAKLLGLFFASANAALIWHILAKRTRSYPAAAIGTAVAVFSPHYVALHSLAMSEPPFLFMLLATFLAFERFLRTSARGWLIASAVLLGLATLTRFTAPPLGLALVLYLLFDAKRSRPRAFGEAIVFALVSLAIFLAWTVASQLTAGHSIGRELSFHGNMGLREWTKSLEALAAWFLPDQVPLALRAVLLAGLVLLLVGLALRQGRGGRPVRGAPDAYRSFVPTVLVLFVFFYLAFVCLATSIEANLSLNGRYAFPAYVAAVIAMTVLVSDRWSARDGGRLKLGAVMLCAFAILAAHGVRVAARSLENFQNGIGYASTAWKASGTIKALRELPSDSRIFTNGPDIASYALKRPTHFTPQHFALRTGLDDPQRPFAMQMQELGAALRQPNSFVAFFDKVDWRFYLASEDELVQALKLRKVVDADDGRIYAGPADGRAEEQTSPQTNGSVN